MEGHAFQEVELNKIGKNPMNPRSNFSGPEFDELVKSVKAKGVLEPILIRPLPREVKEPHKGFPTFGQKITFQLVAGERRFRALCRAAFDDGGLEKVKIPAMVRDMTQDEAFDVMCIENLQRKDLTPLEEAESFKMYLDRHGRESLGELSERTGINPRYIRRRLMVMDLPKKVLKAWDRGDLKYGHLEQLARLKDPKEIIALADEVVSWRGGYSAQRLKDEIDESSIELKGAPFDQEGCSACHQNSSVQKKLFDLGDLKGSQCLNPKCFKQKLNNHLQGNWQETVYFKEHQTNGFRFQRDVNWDEYEAFYGGKARKICKECPHFVTLIGLDGSVHTGRACIGEKSCFREVTEPQKKEGDKEEKDPNAARVPWHGEYFREQFFKEKLPERFREIPEDDARVLRTALFSILKSNHELHEWFGQTYCGKKEKRLGYMHSKDLFETIRRMTGEEALKAVKEASIQIIMQKQHDENTRRLVADHIGIDLAGEWAVTEEYLDKKTIKEIHAWAEAFGIWNEKQAQTYLYEKLLKKRGKFTSCKKEELKELILNCGVDLKGKVPKEILEAG